MDRTKIVERIKSKEAAIRKEGGYSSVRVWIARPWR